MAAVRHDTEVVQVQSGPEDREETMSAKMGVFLRKNLNKGEVALKHAIGLGAQPNVVPETGSVLDGPPRPVLVGWHPVGGLAGKWFSERTGLGKLITDKINKYPDPTQHWAVLVGDYAHQLWMDENFDIIYTNQRVQHEEWRTFHVGVTRFNDDATRRAGESVIQAIREKQPGYNLITNNCQTYALQLLDAIKVGARKEFATTLAVYERLVGPGRIKDLFVESQPPEGQPGSQGSFQEGTVSLASQVMHDNTTQLDTGVANGDNESETQADDADGAANGDRGMGEGDDGKPSKTRKFFNRLLKR
ncbi:uncharacterized protein UV8b_04795 [Ustilaginoidea virens]|uniref:DUF862-domain-containing protein n=1 Tax=Ustilaginoidea virens TaxID=1159556 RepID=A0A8E5HRZ1_USTVR|nr:uncharacterized protein UV8b_04795 [Ustilaginoidea virens]QUC20554.1 hypothetical protein UV8b_04795 [Ustilaginoidea virens]